MHVVSRRRLAANLDVLVLGEDSKRAAPRALLAIEIDSYLHAARRRPRQCIDDSAISQDKSCEVDRLARAADQTFVNGPETFSRTVKQPHASDDGLGRQNPCRLWARRDQKSQ